MASITLRSAAGGKYTLSISAYTSGTYIEATATISSADGSSFAQSPRNLSVSINGVSSNSTTVSSVGVWGSESVSCSGWGSYNTSYTVTASWGGSQSTYCPGPGSVNDWISIGGAPTPPTPTYTVTYNKNTTDTVIDMPANQTKTKDVDLVLSYNIPLREGYEFSHWTPNPDGSGDHYARGSYYSENASVTLYAQWKQKSTVRLYNNGQWKNGKLYVYSNGSFKEGKIYVYNNGSWKEGT